MRPVEDWEIIPASSASGGKANGIAATTPANPDEITIGDDDEGEETVDVAATAKPAAQNPGEINFDDEEDEEVGQTPAVTQPPTTEDKPVNPDEITFDDDDEDAPEEDIVFKPAGDASTASPNTELPSAEEARQALKVDESVDLLEAVRKEEAQKGQPIEQNSASETPASSLKIAAAVKGPLEANIPGPSKSTGRQTKFLALDKVLPGRDFIQVSSSFPHTLSSKSSLMNHPVLGHPNSSTYRRSSAENDIRPTLASNHEGHASFPIPLRPPARPAIRSIGRNDQYRTRDYTVQGFVGTGDPERGGRESVAVVGLGERTNRSGESTKILADCSCTWNAWGIRS